MGQILLLWGVALMECKATDRSVHCYSHTRCCKTIRPAALVCNHLLNRLLRHNTLLSRDLTNWFHSTVQLDNTVVSRFWQRDNLKFWQFEVLAPHAQVVLSYCTILEYMDSLKPQRWEDNLKPLLRKFFHSGAFWVDDGNWVPCGKEMYSCVVNVCVCYLYKEGRRKFDTGSVSKLEVV